MQEEDKLQNSFILLPFVRLFCLFWLILPKSPTNHFCLTCSASFVVLFWSEQKSIPYFHRNIMVVYIFSQHKEHPRHVKLFFTWLHLFSILPARSIDHERVNTKKTWQRWINDNDADVGNNWGVQVGKENMIGRGGALGQMECKIKGED